MAMMPPQMSPAGPPPGLPPPGGAPAAGPSPLQRPGFAQMMAGLAQRGSTGQLPPQIMTLLTFIAGMGMKDFANVMKQLTQTPATPKPMQADAQRAAPGMAMNPAMVNMARLAALRGGMQPGMRPGAIG